MGTTLDYYSVQHWVGLMIQVHDWVREQEQSRGNGFNLEVEANKRELVQATVEIAQERKFNLNVGDRWFHLTGILAEIDEHMRYFRASKEDYLPEPKDKPEWYYLRWRNSKNDPWTYVRVGDEMTNYRNEIIKLSWNGSYNENKVGMIFRDNTRTAPARVREAIAWRHPDATVQVTKFAPEEES